MGSMEKPHARDNVLTQVELRSSITHAKMIRKN